VSKLLWGAIACVIGIVAVIVIVAVTADNPRVSPSPAVPDTTQQTTQESTNNADDSANTESNSEDTDTTSTEPDMILVNCWNGDGIKTTEPFTINEQPWFVNWTSNPQIIDGQSMGLLQIMVYETDQPTIPITLAANTQEQGTDTSYIYQTGTFFLTMNAANTEWQVCVFKPA